MYIFSPSSCLYLPSGSQPGVMLLFYFIFLSREICGRAEMEMVLDILCLEICCFFKSLGPLRQLCLAFLIGRGQGECFIWNAMRQEKELFWSLGKWLSTGCGLYHPLSPYLEPSAIWERKTGKKKANGAQALAKIMRLQGDPEAAKPVDLEGQCKPRGHCVFYYQTGDHMSVPSVTQGPLHGPGRHRPQDRLSCLVEWELRVKNKFP